MSLQCALKIVGTSLYKFLDMRYKSLAYIHVRAYLCITLLLQLPAPFF